jgi:glycolate oxidase iron-sulfur subunit
VYHELIEETRQRLPAESGQQYFTPLMRWLARHLLTQPRRLKWTMLPARLLQRIGVYQLLRRLHIFDLLPPPLRQLERMLPESGPLWPARLPERSGTGTGRPRIGFFAGCIGSVVCDQINRQAIALLCAAGADVYAPTRQACCGAIHWHGGAAEDARQFARRNIDAFLADATDLDFIVTNIAGCGAMLLEYDLVLRDDPAYLQRAGEFSRKVRDISQVLCELPLPPLTHAVNLTVTYHDACHLAHAQKVTAAPRELLQKIPGLEVVPLAQSDLCCGAAGTYNLAHPKMAAELADRKLDNIAATGAAVCVSGNAGCTLHLSAAARRRGQRLGIVHPVELLYQAIFGKIPAPTRNRR